VPQKSEAAKSFAGISPSAQINAKCIEGSASLLKQKLYSAFNAHSLAARRVIDAIMMTIPF
jgi:hypothetical protein